jgi:hypothetical protein
MKLPVIAIVVALAACSDKVESYAYITKTRAWSDSSNHDVPKHTCGLVAKLPHGLLAAKPADTDTSLTDRAMTVSGTIDNLAGGCDDHLHTWMHVLFPADDRTKVEFDAPDLKLSLLWLGLFALVVFVRQRLARDKWRARRQRRRR